jgi:FtsZ-binding cell division protein ZapB
MTDDPVKQAIIELQDLVRCRCLPAYTVRKLRDPTCECDSAENVKVVVDRIEELQSRLRDLGDHAAYEPHMHHTAADQIDDLKREIQELQQQATFWQERAEYWRDLWSRAANRLLQVDPELSGPMTTKAEEIRKITQALKNPDPWKDV